MCKGVKLRVTLLILLTVLIGFNAGVLTTNYSKAKPEALDSIPVVEDKVPNFMSKSPQEGLMEALVYYEVNHPEIVYAQAVLETGGFTSNLCLNSHNLFGLYNSEKMRYYKFNHWTESVVAYIKFVQYKYKPPDDYYEFLDRIGYAEDSTYIEKLKIIVNKIQNDKRRYTERDTISPRH
jgi:hypothetical protein